MPKYPDSMQPTALTFLEDSDARRLAVAWVACKGNVRTWLETAGLRSTVQTELLCTMLRNNGICRAGGVTDPLALQYIQTLLMVPLKRGKPRASQRSS
jgi:hypothetical protein